MINDKSIFTLNCLMIMSIAAILESCNPVFNAIRRQDTAARKTDHKNPVSAMISEDLLYGQQWLSQPGIDTLRLRANDGASLQGYYRPALLKSDKLAILIHGYRADARMMAKYADLYRAWGYNVFMADNRGHGHSGGAYVGMGWLDRLDYQQWLQLLLTRYGDAQQVVIHGISMGASTALMMSGENALHPQVNAIVADCGFTNAYAQFRYLMGHQYHIPAFPLLNLADKNSPKKSGLQPEGSRRSRTGPKNAGPHPVYSWSCR